MTNFMVQDGLHPFRFDLTATLNGFSHHAQVRVSCGEWGLLIRWEAFSSAFRQWVEQ